MCVIELEHSDPKILINPRVTKMSDKMVVSREGCLSLPGTTVKVNRHANIVVEYEDVRGETQKLEAEGLLSNCLQHEIDHLNGILMINRISGYYKEKALKELHRFKKIMSKARKRK